MTIDEIRDFVAVARAELDQIGAELDAAECDPGRDTWLLFENRVRHARLVALVDVVRDETRG